MAAYQGLCTNSGQAFGWLPSMVEPVASAIRAKGDKNKIAVSASALRSARLRRPTNPQRPTRLGSFCVYKNTSCFWKNHPVLWVAAPMYFRVKKGYRLISL